MRMFELQISFCQDLVLLLKSGSDLDSALGVIVDARTNSPALTPAITPAPHRGAAVAHNERDFSHALASIRAQVRQGETLSNALSAHPAFFDRYFVGMVKSGEASGSVLSVLAQLQTQLEHDRALREKIGSALVYPIILVVVMVISLLLVMVYILPQLTGLFGAFSGELSSSAQFLLALGHFFRSYGQAIVLLTLIAILIAVVFAKPLQTKARAKSLITRLPILRRLVEQLEFSRFSASLASLLNAGLTQVDAMTIACEVFSKEEQRSKANAAISQMREGHSFSHAMRVFPEIALYYSHSIESGEKSGQLADALALLASRLERDYALRSERLTTLLEPLLVIFLGLVIGFVIFTVFSTIQSIGAFTL